MNIVCMETEDRKGIKVNKFGEKRKEMKLTGYSNQATMELITSEIYQEKDEIFKICHFVFQANNTRKVASKSALFFICMLEFP